MALLRSLATALLSLSTAAALRVPTKAPQAQANAAVTRRSALGTAALAALPALAGRASAYDYAQGSESFSYKSREYSTDGMMDYATKQDKSKKLECPEGQRSSPDGFGGRTCKGAVKGVTQLAAEKAQEVLTGEARDPAAASTSAPKAAPAAKKAAPPPPPSSSSKPLTLDELIANSIAQKADLLGRDLTDAEKADMTAKVKKLMQ